MAVLELQQSSKLIFEINKDCKGMYKILKKQESELLLY